MGLGTQGLEGSSMNDLMDWGIEIILWLQGFSPTLDIPFKILHPLWRKGVLSPPHSLYLLVCGQDAWVQGSLFCSCSAGM